MFFKKKSPQFKELVDRVGHSPYGGFFDLMYDLREFSNKEGKQATPVHNMAYAAANKLAVAGVYFQGLLPVKDFKMAAMKDEMSQKIYGASDTDYKDAQTQGLDIAQVYLPECTALSIKMIETLAGHERTFYTQAEQMGMQIEPMESTPEDPAFMSVGDCHQLAMIVWQQHKESRSS